ncbi:endonuclease III [bacterium]|nr:endonuclease III [bacterium]
MNNLSVRILEALQLLEKNQGEKQWPGPSDALDNLILTVLSQNTNDNLRDRAYNRMLEIYPSWEEVMNAPTEKLEDAIRIAGLSQQKSERIQAILRWIKQEFGELSLRQLKNYNNDAAIELMTAQKGIGIKTVTVVLMITLGRDLCPVDTHVHRIARRLAWVDWNTTAEKTFWQLRPHVPTGKGHSLHMNLLQFGRTICQARKPRCRDCFLWDQCRWDEKIPK